VATIVVAFATPACWSVVVVVPNSRVAWSGPSSPMVGVVFVVSSLLPWATVGSVMGLEVSGVGVRRRGKDENEPRLSSWFVFGTHLPGLPFSGSPLVHLLPQILCRARTNRPHPSGKGRGGCVWIACVLAGGDVDRAHIPRERGGACFRVVGCG
jgi:hypothetical protein